MCYPLLCAFVCRRDCEATLDDCCYGTIVLYFLHYHTVLQFGGKWGVLICRTFLKALYQTFMQDLSTFHALCSVCVILVLNNWTSRGWYCKLWKALRSVNCLYINTNYIYSILKIICSFVMPRAATQSSCEIQLTLWMASDDS